MQVDEQAEVDISRLQPWEFEALLEELLLQKGFEGLRWHRGGLFDLRVELPKQQSEQRELWLVRIWDSMWLVRDAAVRARGGEGRFVREDLSRTFRLASRSSASVILFVLPGLPKAIFESILEDSPGVKVEIWDGKDLSREILQSPRLAQLLEQFEVRQRRNRGEMDAVWLGTAAEIAHKLGNPISAIEGYLDPLAKRIRDQRQGEALSILEKVRNSLEKAKAYIYQLKGLARARVINSERVMLKPLLEEVCTIAEEKGVLIELSCEPSLEVMADSRRLEELFEELVSNSIYWLEQGEKRIRVQVGKDEEADEVWIRFEDNGPGVPAPSKERIFDPTFTTNTQGSGLGLHFARTIVEGHGGAISEIGEEGKGAIFLIRLPAVGPLPIELELQ